MGVWIFFYRLFRFVQRQRAVLLQAMMPKLARRQSPARLPNSMLYAALRESSQGAWVFFLAVALLTRNRAWNRFSGATLGALYASYLSIVAGVSARWPWVTLLAIAGNLAYLGTAMHVGGAVLPPFVESPADENPVGAAVDHDHYDNDFDEGH